MTTEVSGLVIYKSPNLFKGGIVKENELLWKVDSTNYKTLFEVERSNYEKAILDLEIEKGRQEVAKKDWDMLSKEIRDELLDSKLALRVPHLKEKEVNVEAAKSRLEKAKKDLERTKVYSPFEAVVIDEEIEEGRFISSQQPVAKIVAVDSFDVFTSIPLEELRLIPINELKKADNKRVVVSQKVGDELISTYGKVNRLLGELDNIGRMAKLVISIQDPLGNFSESSDQFPFLLGTFVTVKIIGKKLQDVYEIPRRALREGDSVWVVDSEERLSFKKVSVQHKSEDFVVISDGLQDGDKVVLSEISFPYNGMKVRIQPYTQTTSRFGL